MSKSNLLINENPLAVLPSLAVAVGLEEAIALQQIHYWLNNAKNAGRVDDEGNKWVYNTYAQWQEDNFPFWSVDKVQRVFLNLEKLGVLISAKLNSKQRDMTKFYRIDYDELCTMHSLKSEPSIVSNPHDVKMNQRLPEITQENFSKPAKKTDEQKGEYVTTIETAMQGDLPVTDEIMDKLKVQTAAVMAFESAFGITSSSWAGKWHSGKPEWTRFRKWVIGVWQERPTSFDEYVTFKKGDGKFFGLMDATQIARNPENFYTSWDVFMRENRTEQSPVERRIKNLERDL